MIFWLFLSASDDANYCSVLSKWEFFIKMRAALLLPRVMEEGESKKAALIFMKNSHFDRTLRYEITARPSVGNIRVVIY